MNMNMHRLSIAICLMSLTTLMMELVLTRIFDVILSANMGITCAMFSFGLSGIYVTLRPLYLHKDG